jgi:thiamine-monophosphate kinase
MSLEFDLIETFFKRNRNPKEVILGIGDDSAIVTTLPGEQLVITADMLVEGTHFYNTVSAGDVGYKSLAVNLSDLAAMGATPKWYTLSLCMQEVDRSWLTSFTHGLFELADKYQTILVGGDTTKGPLNISIQALGVIPNGEAVTRAGAKTGDDIYVTGTLGDAALGLLGLQGKVDLNTDAARACELRLHRPTPRVEVGIALRNDVHAMIDCSDGFAADLGHILSSSEKGAEIQLEKIPLASAVDAWMVDTNDWRVPLTGGDDYELIFTAPLEKQQRIDALSGELLCPFTRVGTITDAASAKYYLPNGQTLNLQSKGYTHF